MKSIMAAVLALALVLPASGLSQERLPTVVVLSTGGTIASTQSEEEGGFTSSLPGEQLVAAAIAMAHNLDMQVVAEAVESEADWLALRQLGIDGGRGYWLGRPE